MISLYVSVCLFVVSGLKGSIGESISAQKCKEYGKIFQNSCNDRTFSGERKAKFGEFPYTAALKIKIDEEFVFSCTGALVSKNYVVAPAYCLHSSDRPVIAVRLGQININEETLSPSVQEIKVQKIIIHPGYNRRNKTNVIGLIKLEKDVVFNKNVNPICLNEDDITTDTFMSSGWNLHIETSDGDKYVGHLLKTMLTAINLDDCKRVYAGGRAIVTNNHVCIGSKKDTCDAEPIGTLQVENKNVPCMDSLVAIAGFGKGYCLSNATPDVYTKIYPYISWIESIIWT